MTGFASLTRKLLYESRWLLGLICAALFGLSWFSVYRTAITLSRMKTAPPRMAMRMSMIGGPSMNFSAEALEALTLYWLFLMIPMLLTIVWAISRGSSAIGGELERGSVDLILSRPMSRGAFFLSQVLVTLLGLVAIAAAIVLGNQVGVRFNKFIEPAPFLAVLRPAINLAFLGLSIFGYTVFFSSMDLVKWRPNLIGSTLTLAQFIALAIANQPDWDEWKWLNKLTVLSAFYPIEAAVKGAELARNVGVLALIGAVGIVLAFVIFQRRDLPSGGG